MKDKLRSRLYWFIKNDGLSAVVAFVILASIVIGCLASQHGVADFFNFSILFAIVLAMFLKIITTFLSTRLMNILEDSVKLDTNYDQIRKRYQAKFLTYDNEDADEVNRIGFTEKYPNRDITCYLPVIRDFDLRGTDVQVEDSEEMYSPPDEIKKNYDKLLGAHNTSNIYNQLTIRVDCWNMVDKIFVMNTSRSTFYHSLVTNRAMDFQWADGMTVRDLFLYGPFIPPLEKSVFSNHLGFNGFIITHDGYIPLVKRNRIVSIGKATYGDSIGASLKAKYAINKEDGKLSTEGIRRGIIKEIEDELKISKNALENFSLEKNLIAAYRDIVEGGKPQLLFCAHTKNSKSELEENFRVKTSKAQKKRMGTSWDKSEKELEDGSRFLWIHKDEILKIAVSNDGIIYKGKFYSMMPSASGSIIMLIEYLKELNLTKP